MPTYDAAADCLEVLPDRPLPRPTRSLPGSAERVEVMALRFALGLELFHPADATEDDRVCFEARSDTRGRPQRDCGRGLMLEKTARGFTVPGQVPVPPYEPYSDGPGNAARRERQRRRSQSPEGREKDRLRKQRDRQRQRAERERLLCGGRDRQPV